MTMYTIGALMDVVGHEIEHGPNALSSHPGYARDVLSNGMARVLSHQSVQRYGATDSHMFKEAVHAAYWRAQGLCESPIERHLLAALVTGHWPQNDQPILPVHSLASGAPFPDAEVVLVPQFPIARYRLDFALLIRRGPRPSCILAIECDGADFHDASRDRERDRQLYRMGVLTARVSGAVLHADPIHYADRVIAFALELAIK